MIAKSREIENGIGALLLDVQQQLQKRFYRRVKTFRNQRWKFISTFHMHIFRNNPDIAVR